MRTYGAARMIVKGIADYLLWVAHSASFSPLLLLFLLPDSASCWGQGCRIAPVNPVASSRSGLSFRPM